MNKMKTNGITIAVCIVAISMMAVSASSAWAEEGCNITVFSKVWYANHPTTEQGLVEQNGKPLHVRPFADGKEIFYKANNGWDNGGYKVYRIHDSQVVGSNWVNCLDIQKPSLQEDPIEIAGSRQWYTKHPMTEKTIRQKWGTPVKNCDLENGRKRLFFRTKDGWQNSITRFFVIEQGQVVASGMCQ